METTIIIKNILLEKLEKDSKFSGEKADSIFWKKFAIDLLQFEEDAKPIYTRIYSLELDTPEDIIDELPSIYSQFIIELAESYVLGQTSDAIEYLLNSNTEAFSKEVKFLQTMRQAIKGVERRRIKTDLPRSYERLTFELSETDLAKVAKKKEREDLKKKMMEWDAELVEESIPVIPMLNCEKKTDKETKSVPIFWMKYAAAASVIIAVGLFFFKNANTDLIPSENTMVTKDTVQPQPNPVIIEPFVISPIEIASKTVTVLQAESLGFTAEKKMKIIIDYKDATKRILSLEKLLKENETNQTTDLKTLEQYKSELTNLKSQKDKYIFDGQTLTLFNKQTATDYLVIQTEDQIYYLKKGDNYFTIKTTKAPSNLGKVTNAITIETLDKIHFANQ